MCEMILLGVKWGKILNSRVNSEELSRTLDSKTQVVKSILKFLRMNLLLRFKNVLAASK